MTPSVHLIDACAYVNRTLERQLPCNVRWLCALQEEKKQRVRTNKVIGLPEWDPTPREQGK